MSKKTLTESMRHIINEIDASAFDGPGIDTGDLESRPVRTASGGYVKTGDDNPVMSGPNAADVEAARNKWVNWHVDAGMDEETAGRYFDELTDIMRISDKASAMIEMKGMMAEIERMFPDYQ